MILRFDARALRHEYRTAFDLLSLQSTQQHAQLVTGQRLVDHLVETFHRCHLH